MDFLELSAKRYSVRAYKKKDVEVEKLNKILDAARLAPTAANRQPIHLIVIKTIDKQQDLLSIYNAQWFVDAPYIICAVKDVDKAWVRKYDRKSYADVDAAIVMDHLIMAATDEGLGTCWIAAFDPDNAKKVLGLPDGIEPVVFTPLGYADDVEGGKTRKALKDIVHYDTF